MLSVKCEEQVWGVKCEVWRVEGVKCEMECEVWSVECEV